MNFLSICISASFGTMLGLLYAWLFTFSKKQMLQNHRGVQSILVRIVHTGALRIVLFGVSIYFLLRAPMITPILVLLSFLGAFWAVIMIKKVRCNERSRSL